MLFGTLFDTLCPSGSSFNAIAEVLLGKLVDASSCSEDDERYTRIEGSIQMLETLVEKGHITPEVARISMRDIWRERGLEPEADEET